MPKLTVLKTLSPTDEVLDLNIKPARFLDLNIKPTRFLDLNIKPVRYDLLIYRSYIQSNPPADDPREDFILCNQGGGEGSGS